MYQIINFQTSLFGSFDNISPQTDLYLKLIDSLKDEKFIPSTVEVNVIEPKIKKISTHNRVQMISLDKTWSIVFLQDRIDFNYNYYPNNPDLSKIYNINSCTNFSEKLIKKVSDVLPLTLGNRLAVNGRFLFDHINSAVDFSKSFIPSMRVFNEGETTEWNYRYNNIDKIEMNGMSEICNRVVNVGYDKHNNNIFVSTDINTDALNKKMRFKYQELISFVSRMEPLMTRILTEIEG